MTYGHLIKQRPRRSFRRGRLASQALIFHLWKQRNNLVHNNISQLYSVVFRALDRKMKNIISSRRSNKHFRSLMVLWIR
ncbi:hypothetical protein BRARA_A01761 [Brassica rapa]|uniref:Uncharacterized protein n=1 Tax=Brassica campestris TaxID=3711 RepID=A0A398AMS1_BRACM|nr:hypothetical protein BRARA_A01761 [Brassica rapa]